MPNEIQEAAKYAAHLYCEAGGDRTGRSVRQCITVAAKKHDVDWQALASYIDGAGLRAIAGMDEDQGDKELEDAVWDVLKTAVPDYAYTPCAQSYEVAPDELERLASLVGYDS